jgi:hypothetical protein
VRSAYGSRSAPTEGPVLRMVLGQGLCTGHRRHRHRHRGGRACAHARDAKPSVRGGSRAIPRPSSRSSSPFCWWRLPPAACRRSAQRGSRRRSRCCGPSRRIAFNGRLIQYDEGVFLRALRLARALEEPRLRRHRAPDAGARDRRQYRRLHADRCGADAAAAVRGAGPARHAVAERLAGRRDPRRAAVGTHGRRLGSGARSRDDSAGRRLLDGERTREPRRGQPGGGRAAAACRRGILRGARCRPDPRPRVRRRGGRAGRAGRDDPERAALARPVRRGPCGRRPDHPPAWRAARRRRHHAR